MSSPFAILPLFIHVNTRLLFFLSKSTSESQKPISWNRRVSRYFDSSLRGPFRVPFSLYSIFSGPALTLPKSPPLRYRRVSYLPSILPPSPHSFFLTGFFPPLLFSAAWQIFYALLLPSLFDFSPDFPQPPARSSFC